MSLPTQTFTITRADLVRYAEASGDHNPIHQDEEVARSVGLPGVIAHGMYTMALAARAVDGLVPRRGGGEPRLQVHQPGRGAARGRRRDRGRRRGEGHRRRAHHGRPHRHLRRPEGARHAQGRGSWLTCSATTRPCASVGRPTAWVEATTESELVEAVSAADQSGEPVLVLGGGSNLLVADDGFPGTVVEIGTRGITADVEDDASCGGVLVTVAAGEEWDAVVARAVERGWVGVEALVGHPGRGRRHADPERRRLRPGRRPDDRVGPGLGPQAPRRPHVRQRRLRLRLPALPVQGRPRPARGARRDLPVPAGRPRRARRLRRAGPHPRRRHRRAGADGRRARGGAGAPPRQGDGPRRRRPRHLECRVVLHQPGRRRRGRPRRRPDLARGGRGQGERRLADRARRLRQGVRRRAHRRPRRPLHQAHPRADQPGRARRPTTCWPWRARSATASSGSTASGWSTSRCSSAARSDGSGGGHDDRQHGDADHDDHQAEQDRSR